MSVALLNALGIMPRTRLRSYLPWASDPVNVSALVDMVAPLRSLPSPLMRSRCFCLFLIFSREGLDNLAHGASGGVRLMAPSSWGFASWWFSRASLVLLYI
jgi:hypothetical protein